MKPCNAAHMQSALITASIRAAHNASAKARMTQKNMHVHTVYEPDELQVQPIQAKCDILPASAIRHLAVPVNGFWLSVRGL